MFAVWLVDKVDFKGYRNSEAPFVPKASGQGNLITFTEISGSFSGGYYYQNAP